MKKRFFALLTAVCIALTTGLSTGLTALADGGENSDMTIGMSAQEQCSCTTLCTEGNINPDCPVCGAEGADLTACKGAPLMMRAAPLAADAPNSLYVGNQQVISSSDITYWTTDKSTGGLTKYEGNNDNWNVKYDPSTATLTLSGATIKGGSDVVSIPYGSGIYAQGSSNQPVTLTIELIGENTITGTFGIYVNATPPTTPGTDASLVIKKSGDNGSLTVTGTGNSGLHIISGTGDASLTIENASVVANATSSYGDSGVCVQSGASSKDSPKLSLAVNGGSLTASGTGSRDGILFYVGSSQATGATTSLTVSENAIVDARNGGISALKILETLPTPTPTGENSSGIVFDGSTGTVYGTVALQNELTIGEGESLTLDDGASLNAGNYNVIVDGGTLDESLANSLGDRVKYAPTITTTDLPNGTVGTAYNQTLIADGTAPITWSVTGGDLPDGLSLNESTGEISGTPTTADTYNFTVTATNDAGSDDKKFTLTIGVAPVYSITAEPLKLDFGTLTEGYTPASQTVTITNNGNQELTLTQPASTEHFEVGNLSTLTLPANGTATFTVQPKAGLAAGTYSENIDVTASNNVTLSIPASLTVQKASVPTKPEVPSTGTTSGGSTGESTYPDVEDAQISYEQATRDFWNRTINKIKKADEGDSLRIYIGIHEEIPGDVIQAIRENGVNVTFYNQDGDEVTVYAESAPTKYQAVWTLKQLGNYVLTEQQTPAAQEESPAAQQPADEPTTPTQPAETEAVDAAKPNPSTGEGSGAVIAMIAAAAALAGLGATLRKR